MTIIYVHCDHCGKILNNMSDYKDLSFNVCHKSHNVDLCADCFEKLDEKIIDFCKCEVQSMTTKIRFDLLKNENLRKVAKLKYVDGLTIPQIAEKIGYCERQVCRFIKTIKEVSGVAI